MKRQEKQEEELFKKNNERRILKAENDKAVAEIEFEKMKIDIEVRAMVQKIDNDKYTENYLKYVELGNTSKTVTENNFSGVDAITSLTLPDTKKCPVVSDKAYKISKW